MNSAHFIFRISHWSALAFASICVNVSSNCTQGHYYKLIPEWNQNFSELFFLYQIWKLKSISRPWVVPALVSNRRFCSFTVLEICHTLHVLYAQLYVGASYCVVDPAVGDLRSPSVSEDAVLHALHTWVFPQVPEGRLVLFHIYGWHTQKEETGWGKMINKELWLFKISLTLWNICSSL